MHTLYGIWIDHSRACIVRSNVIGDNMTVTELSSDVDTHASGNGEHHTITNENRHKEKVHNQMHAFCKEVVKHLADADEIAVFGPGTAKNEFKNELEKHKAIFEKLVSVETSDKLTEAEIKAHVKKIFMLPR